MEAGDTSDVSSGQAWARGRIARPSFFQTGGSLTGQAAVDLRTLSAHARERGVGAWVLSFPDLERCWTSLGCLEVGAATAVAAVALACAA
eukprot:8307517-Alexandrium_andersonii.AAC.1